MGGRMLASIILASCLNSSCSFLDRTAPRSPDDSTAGRGTGLVYLGGTGTYDHGCAAFEVTVAGANIITVSPVAGSTCGRIQPVLSGTSTWNGVTRKVQLSIGLRNVDTNTYLPPATLMGWPDSLQQVTPSPALLPLAMTFSNPDATNPDTAAVNPSARLWRYDTLLVSSSSLLQRLDPGIGSRARLVEIILVAGLTQFRVTFHAESQLVDFTVPGSPPDSIPVSILQAIYAPANLVSNDSVFRGGYPRNVVVVKFAADATQADKQTAIQAVNGEVLGGSSSNRGGLYYIRIPDGGGTAPLHAAWRSLDGNPKVIFAVPDFLRAGGTWATPNDGPNWKKADWKLRPVSASGQRLPLEAVALPMAWGCEKGDSLVRIAVVDFGFKDVLDLQSNLTSGSAAMFSSDTNSHGTFVASLIGARGDNGMGMSGALWQVRLDYYNYEVAGQNPWRGVHTRLIEAGRSGAPIINLSAGINWLTNPDFAYRPSLTRPTVQDDTLFRRRIFRIMKNAVDEIHAAGFYPLFVVSAGNDSVDAWWSGTSAIREVDSLRTILVGGSKSADPTEGPFNVTGPAGGAFGSNFGTLVDVAAVGASVYAIGQSGTVQGPLYGSSYAAPVISGIAGLILSANPTLSADSLKSLILAGAQRDPRSSVAQMGGAKIANAYESLRAAAARTGGPLCGNRVWTSGTELWVQRDSVRDERLFNNSYPISWHTTFHGGKRVTFFETVGSQANLKVAVFNGTTWSSGTPTASDSAASVPYVSGAFQSLFGLSHEGDFAVGASVSGPWDTATVQHQTIATGTYVTLKKLARVTPSLVMCLYSHAGVCQESLDIARASTMEDFPWPAVAYHPMKDSVLAAVPWVGFRYLDSYDLQCAWSQDPTMICHFHRYELTVDSSTVWRLRTASGGSPTRLWSEPGWITHLAISESGEGHVMTEVMRTASNVMLRNSVWGENTSQVTRSNCVTEFRRNYSATLDREIAKSSCYDRWNSIFRGMFAPRRDNIGRPPVHIP